MSETFKYTAWNKVEREFMNDKIDREMITGDKLMLARVFIKEGNNKDARDLLTKLVAKNPKADVKDEAQKLLDQLK